MRLKGHNLQIGVSFAAGVLAYEPLWVGNCDVPLVVFLGWAAPSVVLVDRPRPPSGRSLRVSRPARSIINPKLIESHRFCSLLCEILPLSVRRLLAASSERDYSSRLQLEMGHCLRKNLGFLDAPACTAVVLSVSSLEVHQHLVSVPDGKKTIPIEQRLAESHSDPVSPGGLRA